MKSDKDSYILNIGVMELNSQRDVDYKNTDILGMQLVNSLVDQIDGLISLDSSMGAEFKIVFKKVIISPEFLYFIFN
jgi:two-component sensor histidine kinase